MTVQSTEVLIVGGGPAGSVAAATLARAGAQCVVMERDRFPRYHIGESLLPSVLTVLDAIGLRPTIEQHGFVKKFGGLFRWGPDQEAWKLVFGELEGLRNYAFQVIRSEFDTLLLNHARESGATVLESTTVRQLEFAQRTGRLRIERDYSYHSTTFSGPGYFIAGDAACFIDPVLSSGVHLATMSGLMAAACVRSCLLDGFDEITARGFYETSYQTAFHRFIGFLSSFYDQNRSTHSYFWESRQLTEQESSPAALRGAFIKLVTGEQDFHDLTRARSSQEVVDNLISRKINENIRLRNSSHGPHVDRRSSQQLLSGVEGLFPCDMNGSVDGVYLALTPEVRLQMIDSEAAASVRREVRRKPVLDIAVEERALRFRGPQTLDDGARHHEVPMDGAAAKLQIERGLRRVSH